VAEGACNLPSVIWRVLWLMAQGSGGGQGCGPLLWQWGHCTAAVRESGADWPGQDPWSKAPLLHLGLLLSACPVLTHSTLVPRQPRARRLPLQCL